jgi:hypothetical protein
MAANANTSDKGKLICTAGHIHAYGDDTECTNARVAMIAYVGSDTGEPSYTHGLAIALVDCGGTTSADGSTYSYKTSNSGADHSYKATSSSFTSESGLQYRDNTHNSDTYPAFKQAFSNNETAKPANCSEWFLATGYQWNQMVSVSGMGSYTDLRDAFSSKGGRNMVSGYYWSSTEEGFGYSWRLSFDNGSWSSNYEFYGGRVRSVLAF